MLVALALHFGDAPVLPFEAFDAVAKVNVQACVVQQARSERPEIGVELRLPVGFRFATRLEHWPSGGSYPALVCATHDAEGRFSGVQQIFLEGPTRAPVSPARMFLGEPGVIRLAPLDNGTLTLASDVETALLLRGADAGNPVWAAVGASNLRRLGLPPRIKQVNLGLGRSPADRRAAVALTQRLLKEGRDVRWFEPPQPKAARG